jgi:hypothetical protein
MQRSESRLRYDITLMIKLCNVENIMIAGNGILPSDVLYLSCCNRK